MMKISHDTSFRDSFEDVSKISPNHSLDEQLELITMQSQMMFEELHRFQAQAAMYKARSQMERSKEKLSLARQALLRLKYARRAIEMRSSGSNAGFESGNDLARDVEIVDAE
jgi:hypothetical protein